MTSFGELLQRERGKLGWTQKKLAKLSGIAETQISNFEAGQRQPSLRNFVKLCEALKCGAEQLIK